MDATSPTHQQYLGVYFDFIVFPFWVRLDDWMMTFVYSFVQAMLPPLCRTGPTWKLIAINCPRALTSTISRPLSHFTAITAR
jgi:hypothetical protein